MVEVGEVIKLNKSGKTATVRFERKSACDKCGMCMVRKKDMFVRCQLSNSLGAKLGDTVKVEMGAGYVLTAAVIVYAVPLILMVIALALTRQLELYFQITAGVLALAAGFGLAVFADRKLKKRRGFTAKMTELIKEVNENG